jgi:hypothetical protein
LARWRQGTLGVADPLAALRYDPSVDAHLDRLLDWVASASAIAVTMAGPQDAVGLSRATQSSSRSRCASTDGS